jgi:AraC-like DNA-binding protein
MIEYNDPLPEIALRTANQLYIMPHPALSTYIAHYTLSFAKSTIVPESLTLIPDASGCLIFTFDGSCFTSKLWGATTKIVKVRNGIYPMRLFIEFRPGGLYALTGIKQTELTDLQLSADLVNHELCLKITHALTSAKDLNSLVGSLNKLLLSAIQNKKIAPAIISAINNIRQAQGCCSVQKIAAQEFYSERHLNRLFNEYLGMNMKTFTNIIRINHIFTRLSKQSHLPANIAHIAGYYDQAHFIHSFKELCGVTPTDYFKNMSAFYNEPFKF